MYATLTDDALFAALDLNSANLFQVNRCMQLCYEPEAVSQFHRMVVEDQEERLMINEELGRRTLEGRSHELQ